MDTLLAFLCQVSYGQGGIKMILADEEIKRALDTGENDIISMPQYSEHEEAEEW